MIPILYYIYILFLHTRSWSIIPTRERKSTYYIYKNYSFIKFRLVEVHRLKYR